MKYRNDFVTNSSSSSFIISEDSVDYDFFTNVVLKDFYIEVMAKWGRTKEEVALEYDINDLLDNEDSNIGLFIKTKKEIDNEYDYGLYQRVETEEDKKLYYVIDNNCTIRFNWDLVNKIFTDKYNIQWEYGYCD